MSVFDQKSTTRWIMFSYGRCTFLWSNDTTWLMVKAKLSSAGVFWFIYLFFVSFLHSKGPKFDQPSYPGFERDVFKSVSDYFHSLPQPMLTFQYYELFVNVLGMYEIHLGIFYQIVIYPVVFLYYPKYSLRCYSVVHRIGCNVGFSWKWFCWVLLMYPFPNKGNSPKWCFILMKITYQNFIPLIQESGNFLVSRINQIIPRPCPFLPFCS